MMSDWRAAAEVSTCGFARGPPVSVQRTSPLAPISMTCLIGPVRSAACRIASTLPAGRNRRRAPTDPAIAVTACPSRISAEPSAHAAVIATSSSPCFFSQALNKMIGAPATRMPSTAATIFRLVRRWIGNDGLAASAGQNGRKAVKFGLTLTGEPPAVTMR